MVSDHLLTRCALQGLLEREKTIRVIGSGTLDQAQRVCRRREPDLLLFEFHRVDLDPAQVLPRVAKACPSVDLLVLADADVDAHAILLNGATGLVYLQESPQTLVQAIQVIARGGVWLDQAVIKQLVQEAKKVAPPPLKSELTEREEAVLRLLVAGKSDKEIARKLKMGERTVRDRLRRVYDKLEVDSRVKAVVRAVRLGVDQ